MLPGMVPVISRGVAGVSLTWAAHRTVAPATAVTHSFSGVPIGPVSETKFVIVLVSARGDSGNSRTITGVTIGGVSAGAPLVASVSSPNPTAIFGLLAPAGETATIAVTGSDFLSRAGIGVAVLENYQSLVPTNSDRAAATATSISRTISILAGGVGLWCVSTAAVGDITWSNADEQYDESPGTVFRGSAAKYQADVDLGRTVTATWSGSQASSMCAISFR